MPTVHAGSNAGALSPSPEDLPVSWLESPSEKAPGRPSQGKDGRFRTDLQGLRALAVTLVVIYHVWPDVLPGGFIGVDVFFVISGYLIVGSLVREIVASGTIGLVAFYGRRIRRLLPAAASVLLATLAMTVLILPEGRWQGISRDAVASSLNVQNWNQAFSTTSYAGATSAVSPLQHYWSLAVEEQFYLLIPLLLLAIAAAIRVCKTKTGMTTAALVVLCLVTTASLIHSVLFSVSSPDLAYFFTTTRIWELGLGGILAVAAAGRHLPHRISIPAGWAGAALICCAAVTFSTSMVFPGWIALVPTCGAVLCLIAGSSPDAHTWRSAAWWQSLRPVTYIGDISYSLYLWHWPATVFAVYLIGRSPGPYTGAAIIAASLAAAAFSTRFIEKPFRAFGTSTKAVGRHGIPRSTYRSVYVLAGVLIFVPIAAAAVPYSVVQQKIHALAEDYDFASYPGAMALDRASPAKVPMGIQLRPAAGAAMSDQPAVEEHCGAYDPVVSPYSDCVYGQPDGTKSIVLVGDSHAVQFMTPLDIAARENGYRLYVLTRIGCPFNARPLHSDTFVYSNCSNQNLQTARDILEIRPELVVTTAMKPDGYDDALGWTWNTHEEAVAGYFEILEPLQRAGIRVGVIADIPYPGFSGPDCVMEKEDAADCSVSRSVVDAQVDPLVEAATRLPDSRQVDLTDYFCDDLHCPVVIGNVLAYRDNHITNTFARTLIGPLRSGLGL